MEIFEAIHCRNSARWFKSEPVADDVLTKVLEAAIRAPTAMGMEQWHFIIAKSEDIRNKVWELLKEAHLTYYNKANIRSLDPSRMQELQNRFDKGMYKAPAYVVAYLDLRTRAIKEEYRNLEEFWGIETVSAALENVALAAVALRLATCWIGVINLVEEKLNALLTPPDGCKLVALMSIGYPSEETKPRPRTKTLNEVTKII